MFKLVFGNKEKIIIGLFGLLFLFMSFFYFGIYSPQQHKIKELRKELKELRSEGVILEKKLQLLQEEEVEGNKNLLLRWDQLERVLPSHPNIPPLLLDYQEGYEKSNVEFNSISFDQPVDNEGYYEYPINLSIFSDYSQLIAFIQYLRIELPRLYIIDSITLAGEKQGDNQREQELNVTMKIKTFVGVTEDADAAELLDIPKGIIGKRDPFAIREN
jgi:Tfp pilus assembly protein PilO